MNLKVDKDKCISCGMCVSICDSVFTFDDDDQAKVMESPVKEDSLECATEAMENCPTGAIVEE